MNTLNTKTEGSTNPISKHKDSFDRPSKVSPSWSFSVMLIALIGIPYFAWGIHNLKQGSVNFKLEITELMKTELTVIKKK